MYTTTGYPANPSLPLPLLGLQIHTTIPGFSYEGSRDWTWILMFPGKPLSWLSSPHSMVFLLLTDPGKPPSATCLVSLDEWNQYHTANCFNLLIPVTTFFLFPFYGVSLRRQHQCFQRTWSLMETRTFQFNRLRRTREKVHTTDYGGTVKSHRVQFEVKTNKQTKNFRGKVVPKLNHNRQNRIWTGKKKKGRKCWDLWVEWYKSIRVEGRKVRT